MTLLREKEEMAVPASPPDEEGETGTDTPPIVTIDPDDVLPDPGSGSTSQETEEEPPPSQDIRPS